MVALPGCANASPIPSPTPVARITCLKAPKHIQRGSGRGQLPYLSACPIEKEASRTEQSQLLHLAKILMAQQAITTRPLSYRLPCDDYLSLPIQSCRHHKLPPFTVATYIFRKISCTANFFFSPSCMSDDRTPQAKKPGYLSTKR